MALSVTQFIIQRLREYDPNRTVAPGTGWYELMVAPLSVILQPMRDDIAALTISQTVLQVINATDPNAFSEDVLDALLSNLLVDRRLGSRGTTTVRIRFYEAQAFSATAAALTFSTTTGLQFNNTTAQSFTQAQVNVNFDGQFYYVDVPVQSSTEGSGFNVAIGDINTMDDEPANVVDVANVSAVADGVTRETNLELIDRARQEITVRALVTAPGIFSTITNNFESIRSVSPVGMGDDEMMRDIIQNAHVGGYVDAWVKPQSTTSKTWDATVPLVADTTREVSATTALTFDTQAVLLQSIVKDLPHEDIVAGSVVVTNATGSFTYVENVDYTVNYATGRITPIGTAALGPGTGRIPYREPPAAVGPGDSITANVFTVLAQTFLGGGIPDVQPGDRLRLNEADYGGSGTSDLNDGLYTVGAVGANSLTINETFPVTVAPGGFVANNVGFAIYGRVLVSYRYNPVAVDIIATARTGRANYTITDVPVLRVTQVEVLDPITGDPSGVFLDYGNGFGSGGFGSGGFGAGALGDWRIRVDEPNERYSMLEDVFLDFDPAHKGVLVGITFEYSPDVAAIHTYAVSPANRVVAADLLAKHMIPAFFNAAIAYEVLASDATTTTTMLAAISLFIHQLASGATSRLELSDLVDIMYDAGAVKVDLPITGTLDIHNTDGSIQVISSQDDLIVPTQILTDPTNRPLTPRTAHALPGTISLTQSNAVV